MTEMRLISPRRLGVEDLRPELLESYENLKMQTLMRSSIRCQVDSYTKEHSHESTIVIRWQVLLGGLDHNSGFREKFLDKVGVVVEVCRKEDDVVSICSAQQLVHEGTLFDALFVEIRLKAVVGECYDFIST